MSVQLQKATQETASLSHTYITRVKQTDKGPDSRQGMWLASKFRVPGCQKFQMTA